MRRTGSPSGCADDQVFEHFESLRSGRVSQAEAAELLGIGERTFRRWRQRFEDEGEAGLLDRRLVRPRASGFLRIGAMRWRRCIARVTRVSRPSIFMSIW